MILAVIETNGKDTSNTNILPYPFAVAPTAYVLFAQLSIVVLGAAAGLLTRFAQ